MVGIYKITSPTDKIYIGQSRNMDYRIKQYYRLSCKAQTKLYYSLKKHGWEAHTFEVILELREDISQAWMNYWETFFWRYYKDEIGAKMMNIREPGSRGNHSEKTKKRIGEANKTTRKLRGKDHPMFGKAHTKSSLLKMSRAFKGRRLSDETKRKMSISRTGRKCSDETRAKIRDSLTGKNHPTAKPIIQFTKQGEFLKEWACSTDIINDLDIHRGSLLACLRGELVTSAGFKWKYKDEGKCQ